MGADRAALAREAVEWMRAQSSEVQAEAYLVSGEDRCLARREGRRDGVEASESLGAAVRALAGGRAGSAAGTGASLEEIKELYGRAVAQMAHAEPLAGRALPGPFREAEDPAFSAALWDETLFSAPWGDIEERLRSAEAAALRERGVAKVLRSEYSESRVETIVAGTSGLFARERGGSASVGLVAASENGAEVQLGEAFRAERRAAALDFESAGREAGRRAAVLLGAGRAKAGRRSVILEPWVGVEFLELLSELLSAEEAQGGRSLLKGRLGRPVASPLVTLRDDPRRLGGLASARFDDEGVPTRDKAMIERGVLRAFFHDVATAAREGAEPNGCGYRASHKDPLSPGPSNFYLAAGSAGRDDVIAGTRRGLLVSEILGMHMVDPVSGAFSVGVSGLEIEGGAAARPVRGAMISGSLLDLLGGVDAVASDLAFHGSLGAPTIRVEALDVA